MLLPLMAAMAVGISGTVSGQISVAAAGAVPAPADDAFYTPPDPLPAGRPGDVIRHRPAKINVLGLPVPVRAEQVLYRSTTINGAPTAVSGIMLAPLTPWPSGPRPLVGYAVGAHGMGDQCAPSYLLRVGVENEVNPIGQALLRNWAVVLTDYPGVGTPGLPPTAIGKAAGYALLDAVRAGLRLGEFDVTADSPAALWGYSQGGQATAFAAELQPRYAPELRLVGAAAGGVPADVTAVVKRVDGTLWFAVALLGLAGHRIAYPDLPFDSLLNSAGKKAFAEMEQGCSIELATKFAFHRIDEYTVKPGAISDPALVARFAENRPGQATPGIPMFLYHAKYDQIIPPALGSDLKAAYCARGVVLQFKTIPVSEHLVGLVTGAVPSVAWLADRFAGKPAPTSC